MWQTGPFLVIEDRVRARVAAHIRDRARTVAWANQARICKAGPALEVRTNMKQEEIYVGIDVAKARVDVAIRPGGDIWSIDYDEQAVSELISRLLAVKSGLRRVYICAGAQSEEGDSSSWRLRGTT